MNKSSKIIISLGAIAIIAVLWFAFWQIQQNKKEQIAPGQYDNFAKCLADKNIVMYGADWCPHCQNEKKKFGNSWKYVPYVECPKNPQLCLEKRVEGYPTWIFPDGRKFVGEQGLENLSQESGCAL